MTDYRDAWRCLVTLSNLGIHPVRIKVKRGSSLHACWHGQEPVSGEKFIFGGCEVVFI